MAGAGMETPLIYWFLSLFPQFRALQVACESARTELLITQDRLNSALDERVKLWDMVRESISNERTAFQMQVNAQWQKQGFGLPYPEAPHLPTSAIPQHGGGSVGVKPELPSTRVARAQAQFIDELLAEKQVR